MDAPSGKLDIGPGSTSQLLEISISAGYGSQCVLDSVSLHVGHREILGVVGSSGAGKSTLVHSLLGLLPWQGGFVKGYIRFAGQDLLALSPSETRKLRGRSIALVPQSASSALNPSLSLDQHFREAWRAHHAKSVPFPEERLQQLLSAVQLSGDRTFLRRRPSQISVGQAQRILIVTALLHGPRLLIADEPTSALDPITQTEIIRLLARMAALNSAAMLYISHDFLSVFQLCQRVAILHEGRIVECASVSELLANPQHPHTRALLDALPIRPEVFLASLRLPASPTVQTRSRFVDLARPHLTDSTRAQNEVIAALVSP